MDHDLVTALRRTHRGTRSHHDAPVRRDGFACSSSCTSVRVGRRGAGPASAGVSRSAPAGDRGGHAQSSWPPHGQSGEEDDRYGIGHAPPEVSRRAAERQLRNPDGRPAVQRYLAALVGSLPS